jgi:Ca2+/Na+ antiporter
MWLMLILGYQQAPELILQPLVKFPLVILLSVFLTVSFWLLQKAGKKSFSLVFIAMFLFNIGVPMYASSRNHAILDTLGQDAGKGIEPELAELLVKGDDGLERETAARLIYQRYGITLPFKTADDTLIIYAPTKTEKDNFFVTHENNIQTDMAIRNLTYQIEAINFVVALQLITFFVLLLFLILYDRETRQGAEKGRTAL